MPTQGLSRRSRRKQAKKHPSNFHLMETTSDTPDRPSPMSRTTIDPSSKAPDPSVSVTWSETETLPDASEMKSRDEYAGQMRKILGAEKDGSLRPAKTIFIQPIPPFKRKINSDPSKEIEVTPSKGSPSSTAKKTSDYDSFGILNVSVRPPPPKMVILPIPPFKGKRATEISPSVTEQNPDVRPVYDRNDFRSNWRLPQPVVQERQATPNPFFGTTPIDDEVRVKDDFNPFKTLLEVPSASVVGPRTSLTFIDPVWPSGGKSFLDEFAELCVGIQRLPDTLLISDNHRRSSTTSRDTLESIVELGEDLDSHSTGVDEFTSGISSLPPADPFNVLQALSSFQNDVSPWKSPQSWLNNNCIELEHIIADTDINQEDKSILSLFLHADTILQRSVIYTFWHLETFSEDSENTSLLRDFKAKLDLWSTWDNMTSLLNYRIMGDELVSFLQPRPTKGIDFSWSYEDDPVLKYLLDMDVISLCARLGLILSDTKMHRDFLAWRGTDAQTLLNLLQSLLSFPPLHESLRNPFVKALLALSRRSGLFPECLVLRDIEKEGEDPVAAGKFGEVWRGKSGNQQVAIKVLKIYEKSDVQKHLKAFSREAILWKQMDHVNILHFFGVYHLNENRSRVCLVSSWMANGNIRQFLNNNPLTDRPPLISDVAVGLEYLHSIKIIHGDLKGMNILVTPSLRACLADFGLSSSSDSQVLRLSSVSTTPTAGTLRWEAPELLEGSQEHITFPTDIYAYACVCYEIFADNIPFYGIPNDYAVAIRVTQGKRPVRPSPSRGMDDEIWSLVEKCWSHESGQRPAAREIVQILYSKLDFPEQDNRSLTHRIPTIPFKFL